MDTRLPTCDDDLGWVTGQLVLGEVCPGGGGEVQVCEGGAGGPHTGGQGGQSIICTKRQSVASVGTLEEEVVRPPPDKSESMVTTFHLGIVFILLGFIMILSSMIPSSIIKVRTK